MYTINGSTEGGVPVKKLILVPLFILVMAMVPTMAFADFQIGGVAMYDADISQINDTGFSPDYLVYGLEARAKLWIIQGGASMLYLPYYSEILMLSDVGLALDIWFVRLGLGVGPNIGFAMGGSDSAMAGWNLKAAMDINIGNLSVGLVGYYLADSASELVEIVRDIKDAVPVVGVSLMFKLF
jgi:hypothetical protein